ncbi:MAG: hypothetical protein OXD33_13560 [Rhodobacteraceae bacterium]|nr:hypothetical protein [Paracoccaceae bacterium]
MAISYGDNKGDAEWAAGFSFNVEPVKIGAGFDSNGVMSVGMGFEQGQISMNALFSTDSDSNEDDNEAGRYILKGADAGKKLAAVTGAANRNPNMPDLKNQAMGVDVTYKMTDTTSIVLVAAQHKSESASWTPAKAAVAAEVTAVEDIDGLADLAKIGTSVAADGMWKTTEKKVDAFGVGFSHDLGGGATLKAGVGPVDGNTVADLGIHMKF